MSEKFYHGTTREGLSTVTPADHHGEKVMFPHDTDHGHAYASSNEDDAWGYAEKAWNASSTGVPRVYEVKPTGTHEKDPATDHMGRSRGNFEGDVRSKDGFRVVREMPMPEHMGPQEDWK